GQHSFSLHLIPVLSACTATTCRCHLHISVSNFDINAVVYQWIYKHRCKRCMPAGITNKRADTHQAMNATFSLEQAISKLPSKLQGSRFDTCSIAPLPVHLCHLPALFLTVHAIHTGQHLCPILAFRATSSGINLYDCR